MKYFSLILTCTLFFACGNNSSSEQSKATPEQTEPVAASSALPSIPADVLQQLFLESDYVDYIFYELPISMSYDNQNAIQSALRWVSENADVPSTGCKALGRMIFQKEGSQIMEAELYVSDSCGHYIWYVDGKKTYSNMMTNTGQGHYMGIINQFVSE